MNRYQKEINKITKQRRKLDKVGVSEKDFREINNLIIWKDKFKEELKNKKYSKSSQHLRSSSI